MLRAKLRRLEGWNALRREAADRYADLLADTGLRLPVIAEQNLHVWHLYVVRVEAERRQRVMDGLGTAGVGCGIHYPKPIHLHTRLPSSGTVGASSRSRSRPRTRWCRCPCTPA